MYKHLKLKMELTEDHVVATVIEEFEELVKNPEIYIERQPDNAERFKQIAKKIYACTINSNIHTHLKTTALSKLIIDGFDEEQIWQQIELQNKAAIPHFSEIISKIISSDISFAVERTNIKNKTAITHDDVFSDNESNIEEEYAFDDDSDSSTNMVKSQKNAKFSDEKKEYAFDDESDSSVDMDEISGKEKITSEIEDISDDSYTKQVKTIRNNKIAHKKQSTLYKSEVDDQFFKLSKLEEFLKIEDLKEEREDASIHNSADDEIDLFQDIPSDSLDATDEESDDEKGRNKKSSKDIMYEDFFDEPESGDESIDDTENYNNSIMNENKKSTHIPENMSDKEGNEFDAEMEDINHDNNSKKADANISLHNNTQKSAFEIEQEKIKKKIEECEKSMLEPLPWHLTGEVAASTRPVDSLLQQETDFDSNVKQDLIVDSALTEKVENIIKMAIINKAFCDVERKVKSTEEIIAYKKEIVVDQTKSKKSLAQVYEEDYLKKQNKQEEEENPKHKEIKKLMDSLLPELHALFSHIPKPAVPEMKVVTNLPAITVEEVAPTSVSDVTLLAPEEVKHKSGLIQGKSERTETDKKRARRKKKMHQKLKEKKKKEKIESQNKNPSAKMSKMEKIEVLKKLKQNKNTKVANMDEGGKIKSSKDFFSRLQDTMDSKIRIKNKMPYKKKKK